MILGTIAQDDRADSLVVSSDVHIADFSNQIFTSAGVSVTAEDVIGSAASAIAGSGGDGLMFNDDFFDSANLAGGFLSAMLSGIYTVIMEFELIGGSTGPAPFVVTDSVGGTVYFFETVINYAGPLYLGETTDVDFREFYESALPGTLPTGIHKLALSRTDSRIVYSIDGATVVGTEDDLALTSCQKAALGGIPDGTVYDYFNVRYFEVRETAVSDDVLQQLATP